MHHIYVVVETDTERHAITLFRAFHDRIEASECVTEQDEMCRRSGWGCVSHHIELVPLQMEAK